MESKTLSRWWPGGEHDPLLRDILVAYAAPERRYHDVQHLSEVLLRADEIIRGTPDFAIDPQIVHLAAFFHDAVYGADNVYGVSDEEASARWAQESLTPRVGQRRAELVAALVRATETHRFDEGRPGGNEARVLLDADLAILAADRQRYAQYSDAVRREYAHVPQPDFAAARAGILEQFLARDHLYCTEFARDAWEAKARANVAAEIAELVG